jgi:hypothetical protein
MGGTHPLAPSLMKRRGTEAPLFSREGFRVSLLDQYCSKFFQHFTDVSLDILILESDYLDAQIVDDICPQFIVLLLVVMILPVDFHHKTVLIAVEICNKESLLVHVLKEYGKLAKELFTQHFSSPDCLPE